MKICHLRTKKCPSNCPSITLVVRVIERQDRGKNCPAAIFTPRQPDVSLGPLGKDFIANGMSGHLHCRCPVDGQSWDCDQSVGRILVAQCSATPATVATTPPCSATPFQTQISVRHLPGMGGGEGATPKFLGGVARHRCYTCKTL